MRIVMVIDNLVKGGKERRLLELLKFLDKKDDIQVLLILLKDRIEYPDIKELKHTKVQIVKRKIKKDPTVFFRLSKIYKNFKPDLIHSWGSMPSIYTSLLCYMLKIPFLNAMIADCFCDSFTSNWFRSKITFPFSDIILSNSYSGLEAYKAPLNKGRVIYNGVFLKRFNIQSDPQLVRQRLNIKTKFVIGMVAAFHPRKDYKTFITSAIEILTDYNYDVTFVTIGDGSLFGDMKALVPSNLEDKILFLGKQDHVEEIVNVFDIGVLMSKKEGFPNAVIEYMAMGKPVIASHGGGVPELIDHGINGIIIPAYNQDALVRKIDFLLSNKEVRIKYGENAKAKITNGFTIENMASQYIELYTSMIHKNNTL